MNRRGFFAALSVLLVAFMAMWASPAQAGPRPSSGAIKGVVYNMQRQTVAGARVSVIDSAGRTVAGMSSGRAGDFGFRDLRPGNYIVTAAAASGGRIFQGRAAVTVVDGRISNVRIVVQ